VNISEYVDKIFLKRYSNCGQSCDALKRLLVPKDSLEDCINVLNNFIGDKQFGHYLDEDTEIGPVTSKKQIEFLTEQIADAVSKGARVVRGGKKSEQFQGAYFEPTIIIDINPSMRIWTEEVFGPVLMVIPFSSEEEAIEIANCTEYGLGAIIFTKDIARADRVASQLEAGTVEINGANHWLSCNPFGGYKKSGMGREHGIMGFKELCQVKVISREK